MSKHYVKSAYLTNKDLKFNNGMWIRTGFYYLNSGAKGRFELLYFNNYLQEAFIESLPELESYKYIKRNTFSKNEEVFIKQILLLIKSKIDEELAIVKKTEATLVNPKISILNVSPNHTAKIIGIKFRDGQNNKAQSILLEKHGEWDWKFNMNSLKRRNNGFVSSTWMQELWEQLKEEPDAKFPLLLM